MAQTPLPSASDDSTAPARFLRLAQAFPERLAIQDERRSLSYGALLERCLEAAAALEGSPAERVALLCDHDAGAIVGLLGVLLAGRTAVPLDPTHPRDRLAWMLDDAQAEALLASEHNQQLARSLSNERTSLVPWSAPRRAALTPVDPGSVAYLLYTSGSSGQPKGVYQSHRNLLQQILTYGQSLELEPEDRLTLLPSYSVDAALMDIFGALLHGASLHLWDLRARGAGALPDWLFGRRITVYHSTPTVYRALMAEVPPCAAFPRVRRVVLGGEPARPADLAAFRRHFRGPSLLVNGFGPTESTLGLQAFFDIEATSREDPLPIGRPVSGVEVRLLDEEGREGGEEGEIALRSSAVALGYWRRPDLDRAAFLPDPDGGGRRIYRTGDRGRRQPDGTFTFVGRRDRQIKLRGHRIELGEIEACLRGYPEVAEAVVLVEPGPLDEPLLVAHVECPRGAASDSAALLRWLRSTLPEPMVPSRIRVHAALPLTTSGKVDRLALRGEAAPAPVEPDPLPCSATATWLLGLWKDLFGDVPLGPESDFFALGGHSLLAARLLSRIRARHPVDPSPALIFEHRSLGALAARLDALAVTSSLPPLRPADRSGPLPLSFAQERLWFFERLVPGCPVYHVAHAFRLRGPLDREALRKGLAELVRRHEALRTAVRLLGDRPVQSLLPAWEPALEAISLLGVPESDRLVRARGMAVEAAKHPFDLQGGRLLRATLFALGEDDHLFLLAAHHLVADGWAAALLLSELGALYAAFHRGSPSPLDEPRFQYADFAAWQRSAMAGESEGALLDFWKERLRGAPPLDLPLDRPRPPTPTFRGRTRAFTVPAPLAAGLRELGRRAGVTLHMTFLAAFALLLSRYSGQDDIALGTPVANRSRTESEGVVGSFVNTVIQRLLLADIGDVRALLERAREVASSAQAHQDLPFERLVAELSPERSPGREPLFQAMLIVHNTPPVRFVAPELESERVELDLGTALCDLTLTVREEGELWASLEYATDVFDDSTIERMEGHLLTLLRGMAESLDRAVDELPLLTAAERETLLACSAGAARAIDFDRPIQALIEAQAAATPDAPAAVFEERSLSYRELMVEAGAIAARLRERGIGRGSLVPVLGGRSLEIVPAWLGVLMAGAGFVPLDPRWPARRITSALEQVGGPVCLELEDGRVGWARAVYEKANSTQGRRDAEAQRDGESGGGLDPIYGIFTSGSTGAPRLALIPHRGICNRFAWMDEAFGGEPPITLATTAPVFDSAVWQLLWPLTRGGTVILPSATALSAGELLSLVERHRVTLLDFVPSVFEALIDALIEPGAKARLASVREVILGGETVRSASSARFQAAFPGVRLTNLYGPTEASIGCISHVLAPGEGPEIPIGRPISNVAALLLDRRGRLVPLGVPGEIHLGGACVGLGYLGDAPATERAFLENPFPALGGPRLYRTGDLGRRRADGALLFLGRADDQIKLRGQRIEPREVEAALERHPTVKEAAVLLRERPSGDRVLVAFVAPEPGAPDLGTFLRARLPEPLIPARFVALPALPRSAAGKIDRRALASLPLGEAAGAPGAAPRSEIERRIAAVWASVLSIAEPDLDAGFFDLGGHSLLLLRVEQQLGRELGREIPLIELFRRPTIRSLAAWIAGGEEPAADAGPDPRLRAEALRRQRTRRRGE